MIFMYSSPYTDGPLYTLSCCGGIFYCLCTPHRAISAFFVTVLVLLFMRWGRLKYVVCNAVFVGPNVSITNHNGAIL